MYFCFFNYSSKVDFLIVFLEESFYDLWSNGFHYQIYHYVNSQMYFCIFFNFVLMLSFFLKESLWSLIKRFSLSDLSLFRFSDVFLITLQCWFFYHFFLKEIFWSLIRWFSLSELSLCKFSDVYHINPLLKKDFMIFGYSVFTTVFIIRFIFRCFYRVLLIL